MIKRFHAGVYFFMELWFTEKQTSDVSLSCKVKRTLYRAKTRYQDLAVLETFQFGRMLVLDGMVQATEVDEFIYHEMIAHVPMQTHSSPSSVLVVGGGDGGTIREILKHPQVKEVTLVEIDSRVVEASRRYLPELSASLEDSRVKIEYTDGVDYVRQHESSFDVVIVDSTEPVGPAVGLFGSSFYESAYRALKDDGVMVAQTESPFFNATLISTVYRRIKGIFPLPYLYLAPVPTYPSGLWSFMLGSKRYNPLQPENPNEITETKYYTPQVHRSSFTLPRFVQRLLEE